MISGTLFDISIENSVGSPATIPRLDPLDMITTAKKNNEKTKEKETKVVRKKR